MLVQLRQHFVFAMHRRVFPLCDITRQVSPELVLDMVRRRGTGAARHAAMMIELGDMDHAAVAATQDNACVVTYRYYACWLISEMGRCWYASFP
jgi:hypothetical protein